MFEFASGGQFLSTIGQEEVPFNQWESQNAPGVVVLVDNPSSVGEVHRRSRASLLIFIVRTVPRAREVLAIRADILIVSIGTAKETHILLAGLLVVGTRYFVIEHGTTEDARVLIAIRQIHRTEIAPVSIRTPRCARIVFALGRIEAKDVITGIRAAFGARGLLTVQAKLIIVGIRTAVEARVLLT